MGVHVGVFHLHGGAAQWHGIHAVDQVHPDAHSESMLDLPTPALTGGGGGCIHERNGPSAPQEFLPAHQEFPFMRRDFPSSHRGFPSTP